MTNPNPNDGTKRDASPVKAQPERSSSAPTPSAAPKGTDPVRTASKTTEILKAASAGLAGPSPSTPAPSQGARVDAKSPGEPSQRDSSTRSGDGAPSAHSDRSDQHPKGGSRDDSSRRTSGRDEGTVNAVRSLITSFEQIVREIPRGAEARFEGVTKELAKARKSLDQDSHASMTSASGSQPGDAKTTSAAPNADPRGNVAGTNRTANPKDDTSSPSPFKSASL